jgi:hypothetical protein
MPSAHRVDPGYRIPWCGKQYLRVWDRGRFSRIEVRPGSLLSVVAARYFGADAGAVCVQSHYYRSGMHDWIVLGSRKKTGSRAYDGQQYVGIG